MMRALALLVSLVAAPVGAETSSLFTVTADAVQNQGQVALALGRLVGDGPPEVAVVGTTRAGNNDLAAPDARFHIGSISKSFTATLLMILAERGVIDFDAPLSDLLPDADLHPDWRGLTLTQILSHTAGLPPNPAMEAAWALPGQDLMADRAALLATIWDDPLPTAPGHMVYSNLGYILAGHVAEVATGRAWEDLILTELAGPLGLTSLGFGAPADVPGQPWGHQAQGVKLLPMDPALPGADNPPVFGPAGTIHLSAADLLAWGRFHVTACRGQEVILSADGCARLHQPVVDGYGLGMASFPLPGTDIMALGHDGSNTMWYAVLMIVPDRDMVLVTLQNDGRAQAAQVATRALVEWALQPGP